MKYSTEDYAKALAAVVLAAKPGEESVIRKNFRDLLQKNGDEARGEKILAMVSQLLRREQGGREVVFESARKLTPAQHQKLKRFLRPGDEVALRENPNLIAGVRITTDGEYEFDGSLRGKLDKIFGNI